MGKKLSTLLGVAACGLGVAAVVTELRKPPYEREGYGRVAGVVPYDFRPPTPDKLRRTLWDPDGRRVIVPHAFGVGWSVNLGRLWRLASRQVRRGSRAGDEEGQPDHPR